MAVNLVNWWMTVTFLALWEEACLLSFFTSWHSFDQLGLQGRMDSTVISYSELEWLLYKAEFPLYNLSLYVGWIQLSHKPSLYIGQPGKDKDIFNI